MRQTASHGDRCVVAVVLFDLLGICEWRMPGGAWAAGFWRCFVPFLGATAKRTGGNPDPGSRTSISVQHNSEFGINDNDVTG